MAMTLNGKTAIKELKEAGIQVLENWSEGETVQFGIAHQSDNGCSKYFDMTGEWIRESFTNGEYINRMAVRQDIVEILDRHRLDFDFYDGGTLEVYDNGRDKKATSLEASTAKSEPRMSSNAFLAFKKLARLGAPVWDHMDHASWTQRTELPHATQFVMKCEPKFDIVFADHATEEIKHFSESNGLALGVFEIVSTHQLEHLSYLHWYERGNVMPEPMIAFVDPNASEAERGQISKA